MYSRKQYIYTYITLTFKHLQSIPYVSHFLLSCLNLHLIHLTPSKRKSTRFDNELAINLTLSINC